jgi:hypothetical protein
MGQSTSFRQEFEDREYETAITERMEALYERAYKRQLEREQEIWKRRKSGIRAPNP